MERILVSACLLGQPVRWDGRGAMLAAPQLRRWQCEGRLVVACPELLGGLAVPRPPAEIEVGRGASEVLAGTASVRSRAGADLTGPFLAGARRTLALARDAGCRYALLKNGSPSCGVDRVHDGRFAGRRVAGEGVTAALLRGHGVEVFTAERIDALAARLASGRQDSVDDAGTFGNDAPAEPDALEGDDLA